MFTILFVCTGNIRRSPMAEVMLKHMLPETLKQVVEIHSAGIFAIADNPADSYAIQVMESYGIDLTRHRARPLTEAIVRESDLILVMEQAHAEMIELPANFHGDKIRLLGELGPDKVGHDVFDPNSESLDTYKDCALTIKACLEGVVRYLERLINSHPFQQPS